MYGIRRSGETLDLHPKSYTSAAYFRETLPEGCHRRKKDDFSVRSNRINPSVHLYIGSNSQSLLFHLHSQYWFSGRFAESQWKYMTNLLETVLQLRSLPLRKQGSSFLFCVNMLAIKNRWMILSFFGFFSPPIIFSSVSIKKMSLAFSKNLLC